MDSKKDKIKIVIGINDFVIGGGQKLIADVLKCADREKFSYHLVSLRQFGDRMTFYNDIPEHVHVHKLNFGGFLDIASWKELIKLLRDIRPDVAWSHMFFGNTVFRILKIPLRYRVIANEHNTYTWKNILHKIVDHLLAYITDKIVAVSETVMIFTSRQEWISKDRFTVISNGVDVARLRVECSRIDVESVKQELGIKENQQILINIARLSAQKNQELLLRSFSYLVRKRPNCVLLVIGEGSLRQHLLSLVKELGIEEKVRLLGARKDVVKFLAISDLFVLTSKIEGFGIVCIEAMACGLPVISTHVAGPDTYVKDNSNGYLAKSTPEDISEKMRCIVDATPEARHGFEMSALETAEMYDIKDVTKKYETLFLK